MAEQKAVVVLSAKDKATPVLNKLGGTLKVAVVAAAAAAVAALAALTVALVKATQAANVQEEAEVKLAVALRSTGQASRETLDGLKAHASGLQQVTQFGDETILGVQALLIQLGRLSETEDIERATEATLQFAAATGTDLKAAALLVAKAAQGQTASLSRYGLILKEDTPPQEKFNELLLLMETNFGGTAEALGATFQGRFKQATNAFGDLQEQVGFTITQSGAMQELLGALGQAFVSAGSFVEDNRDTLVRFVKEGVLFVVDGVELISGALQKIAEAAAIVNRATVGTIQDISGFIGTALKFYGLGGEAAIKFAEDSNTALLFQAKAQEKAASFFELLAKKSQELGERISATSDEAKDATESILSLGGAAGDMAGNVLLTAEEIDKLNIKLPEVGERFKDFLPGVESLMRVQEQLAATREKVADLGVAITQATDPEAVAVLGEALVASIGDLDPELGAEAITTKLAEIFPEIDFEALQEQFPLLQKILQPENIEPIVEGINATTKKLAQGAIASLGAITQGLGPAAEAAKKIAKVQLIATQGLAIADAAKSLANAAKATAEFNPVQAALWFTAQALNIAAAGAAGAQAAKFAGGGFVPALPGSSPNRDSVLAALTPGELVIPKPFVSEMAGLFGRGGRAGGFQDGGVVEEGVPGAPGGVVNVTVMPTEPSTLGPLLDAMNEAVERLGFRLIASEVEA